jgi:uncharacterized protein (TIGR00369 family)
MTVTRSDAGVPFVIGGPESAFRVAPVTAHGSLFRGTMETGNWVIGPDGTPSFGSLGVLVDDILGYPVVTARPPGNWATSTEISVSFCAPLPEGRSTIQAESCVVSLSPSGGLAQTRVFDAAGQTIALGSQRLRFIAGTPAALSSGGPAEESSGYKIPAGTILDLLSASISRYKNGAALVLPLGPSVSNPMGTLHGGIMLCASELAGHAAVQSHDHPVTTSSVNIAYLRPGPVKGQATFEATILHRGRTLAVAQVVSRNPEGKICTLATVTCHREA